MSGEVARVLHVIDSLGLSGGAEQQLVTNLSHFDDAGIEHHVTYLYNVSDPSWTDSVEVPVVALNGSASNAPLHRSAVRLFRLVRRLQPDLIHCSLANASLISRIVGWITGIPVLESLVNISHEPIRTVDSAAVKPWKLLIHRQIDRLTMGRVSAFHALTTEVARSWQDTVGLDPEKITVIPRGLSLDLLERSQLQPQEREKLRIDLIGDAEVMILAVGREEAQKGHRYLIDTFAEVLRRGCNAHLVMLGRTGTRTNEITRQIEELNLTKKITRRGVRDDVYRHMRAADMLVFPSLFEGLGVSLLEAMGCGLPVIVFDRPPMNQIVQDNLTGLVVPDRDVGALADAVFRLASDPWLRASLGGKAESFVRDHYDVRITARMLQDLYRKILGTASHQESSR